MEEVFEFKKFKVHHGRSSMKIGVDAVLLGSWAGKGAKQGKINILDVGTGCGVIAMMMKQRFPESKVIAIDCDEFSVEESAANFKDSPWSDTMTALKAEFPEEAVFPEIKFDLIVSNPPFFNSGVINPDSRREKARHRGKLSVISLLKECDKLLSDQGRLALIFPAVQEMEVRDLAKNSGWYVRRVCRIRNNKNKPEKRMMFEFSRNKGEEDFESLTLFKDGQPTVDYRKLCKDFYLQF